MQNHSGRKLSPPFFRGTASGLMYQRCFATKPFLFCSIVPIPVSAPSPWARSVYRRGHVRACKASSFLCSVFFQIIPYPLQIHKLQQRRRQRAKPLANPKHPPDHRPDQPPSHPNFSKIRVSPPSVQKSANSALYTPYRPSKRPKPPLILHSLPPASRRRLKFLCKFQNKGLKIGKFFV